MNIDNTKLLALVVMTTRAFAQHKYDHPDRVMFPTEVLKWIEGIAPGIPEVRVALKEFTEG